jgi:hypothetical protein
MRHVTRRGASRGRGRGVWFQPQIKVHFYAKVSSNSNPYSAYCIFLTCTLRHDHFEKDEMGRVCSTNGGKEERIYEIGIGLVLVGLFWLRIGTCGGGRDL